MAVYYKFKSAKDYESIHIDGHFISVANLKEKIFESKHLGRGTDFDLIVTHAQTNEEYLDEATLLAKNTSVLVRRVPGRPRLNIVIEQDKPKVVENKIEDAQPTKINVPVANSSAMKFPIDSEWDDFGDDLYAIPEILPVQLSNTVQDAPPSDNGDENSKIRALVDTPALDWQRQTQEGLGSDRGFGRGLSGRIMGGQGFGQGRLGWTAPPPGYICHRCKVPGHLIQHCPTNGDPTYDYKRVKPPTGIPRSMLMSTPNGSYALPSGAVAVLKPNEAAFDKEVEGLSSTRSITEFPPEFRCPLCKEVMKDAVLTSKCCFNSFCDRCIRDHIISKSMCTCGATNVLADDLLPNKTLRDSINRILESNSSSSENAASVLQIQDMESAHSAQPKVPSPILSATTRLEKMPPPHKDDNPVVKALANEGKVVVDGPRHSLEKGETAKTTDISEVTLEVKKPTSQGSTLLADEKVQQKLPATEQGKKKKKKKSGFPVNAAEMLWRTPQDLAAESYMMPYASSVFNYNSTGLQFGMMDGYVAPYTGSMQYMSYNPGLFDVPCGAILPQDPFGGQGYMFPVPHQREFSDFGVGLNPVPPVMSREEFGTQKSDLRKKCEAERHERRQCSMDHRECGREVNSGADFSLIKSKPKVISQAPSVDHRRTERASRSPVRSVREAQHGSPQLKRNRSNHHHHHHHRDDDEERHKNKRKLSSSTSFRRETNDYKDYGHNRIASSRKSMISDYELNDDSDEDNERNFKRRRSWYESAAPPVERFKAAAVSQLRA